VRLDDDAVIEGVKSVANGEHDLIVAGDGVLLAPPVAHLVVAKVRRVSAQVSSSIVKFAYSE